MLLISLSKINKLIKILTKPVYWRGAIHRVAAGIEHEKFLKRLIDCKTVVDIGANRGQFALVARHYLPNAMIYSFEPLPKPASVFQSIFKNDPQVILFTGGVGSVVGKFPMNVSQKDDSSSLLPISKLQESFFPGTRKKEEVLVEIAPLDHWIKEDQIYPPALIKIDVQGYELEVLKGIKNFLDHFKYIYIESSFYELYVGQPLADDIINFLYSKQFRFRGIYNLVYDSEKNAVQGDFFFEKRSTKN
ncbi:FkbM family methyltransferase [Methylacidiphilum kamchatkense Kam1]|uniref:FkbM family methyltransferase n=2 Tax=Methylacidiphilum kamchatkense TaxID=431057 RepID=A0A516TNQ6_9BACT|nr:FkbM family methyltransferase [Methylacidiphilum kamchatkense Kam1]